MRAGLLIVGAIVAGYVSAAQYAPIRAPNNTGVASYQAIDHDALTHYDAAEHIPQRQAATDCAAEVSGVSGELCQELDDNALYVCEIGPCDGSGWVHYGGGAGHDPVTLSGVYDYATIADQVITLGQIDLAADVTGLLPWAAVGATPTTLSGYGITDAASQTALNAHEADAANPHAVTAAQVGALPISGGTLTGAVRVQGYDLATPAEVLPGASFEAPMDGVPSRLLLTQDLVLSAAAGTDLAVSQIWLQQAATGGWTVAVPGTWKWIGGSVKAVATDPGAVTFLVLRRNPWGEIEIAVIDYSVPTP